MDPVYITMDMDWAPDGVLADTIELVDRLDIPVCLFVTHATPMLDAFRADGHFTLGVHPNFTPQLNGQSGVPVPDTLAAMREIVPEADSLRCHALVDATPILTAAASIGFKRDMNLFIPYSSEITLKPFRHFSGIRRIPYFYEDDAWCLEPDAASPEQHLGAPGLRVFNFHPIHLFLNTETMDRYRKALPHYQDPDGLRPFINPSETLGARAFLTRIAAAGVPFGRIEDL